MSELKKYSSILIKGTAAVSIANAGTQVISILLLPLFTYYLSPEDYGIFSLVALVITMLTLIYDSGLKTATVRLYHDTEDEDERKSLIGSAHTFFLFIPAIPVTLGLVFGPYIFSHIFNDFDFYPFGFLALLIAFFSQPSRIWHIWLTLQYKVQKVALFTAISVLLGILTSLILVVGFKMGAMGKVIGMFPGAIFLFIISFREIKRYTKGVWTIKSIKKQLLFAYPLIPAIWAYEGLNFAGKYMLENMSSLESVGLYSLGVSLSTLPMILVLGFKQLWNPIFYENMNKKNYSTISQLITYFISGLSLLCILWILFSKETVLLFINERYYSIIPIIGFLILGVYFNGLLTISNTMLSYNKKFAYTSLFATIAVIFNILLNFILIPKLNILGAALSLAASYFLFFLLGVLSQKKTLLLIQKKGTTFIPITILLLTVTFTFFLGGFYVISQFNWIEVMFKIMFFCIVLLLFFKLNLLRMKEFIYVFNTVKNKFKRG